MQKGELFERFEEGLRNGKNITIKQFEQEYGPFDEETKEELATLKMAYLSREAFLPPAGIKERCHEITKRQGKEEGETGFNAISIFKDFVESQSAAIGGEKIPVGAIKRNGIGLINNIEKEDVEPVSRIPEQHLHLHLEQKITPKGELNEIEKRLKGKMRQETKLIVEFMYNCHKSVQRLIKHELNKILKTARTAYEKKDYNGAIDCYDQAIHLEPNCDDAWTGFGVALRRLKKPKDALNFLKTATEINPHNDKAWSNQGIALCELQCYKESLPFYKRAIKENPKNHWAYFGMANALMKLKKSDKALLAYQNVTELVPDYNEAWLWAGVLLFHSKRYDEALESFKHTTDKFSGLGWELYANTLKELNKSEEARIAFEKALQHYSADLNSNPKNMWVWRGKGDVLKELGREEEAKQCLQRAEELKQQETNSK